MCREIERERERERVRERESTVNTYFISISYINKDGRDRNREYIVEFMISQ